MGGVKTYGEGQFEKMRKAGRLAAQTLDYITPFVKPGVTTEALDDLCAAFIADHGAIAAPLNYKGYPKSTCISINEVVCHGIPSADKRLKDGDIVNIDVTVIVGGWFGDTSRMYYVGEPDDTAAKLVKTTYDAMMRGIKTVRPGSTLGDLAHAIQSFSEGRGYAVVRDFCGHGIGQVFHQQPNILHFVAAGEGEETAKRSQGLRLKKGMIFTVEPMLNIGTHEVKVLADGWTAVTRDRSLSAQFEHTIGVTADGCEIFTLSPQGLHCPPYPACPPYPT